MTVSTKIIILVKYIHTYWQAVVISKSPEQGCQMVYLHDKLYICMTNCIFA
jgi:hypothetical protein